MRLRSRSALAVPAFSLLALGILYACSDSGGPEAVDTSDATGTEASAVESGGGTDTGGPDVADGPAQADADAGAQDTGASDAFDASDGFDGFDGNTMKPIRCTQAEFDAVASAIGGDYSAAGGVQIDFPVGATPAQYTKHCIKVKANDVVTFAGAFGAHPLMPFGGNEPTPIPIKNSGTTLDVVMSTTGDYGFQCMFHPNAMFGAIQVVP